MVISVNDYKQIRQRYLNGESQRSIAKSMGISRNTVKKYCEGEKVPWERKTPEREASVLTEDVYSTQFGGTTLRMPGFTSSPVSSHRKCSSLISSKSSVFRGHLNFPSSSLLYSNRNLSPSQTKALIRSFRLPQKRNSMSVSKGFRLNRSRTVAASPSIPYLKSVYPQAM